MQQVLRAAEILSKKGISSKVWSVTSYGELHREAAGLERTDIFSPTFSPGEKKVGYTEPESERVGWRHFKKSRIYECLGTANYSREHVCVAVSDNIRAVPELIRPWIPQQTYIVLGTDGFGRSDTRSSLRRFFEIDAEHIALATINGLCNQGLADYSLFESTKKEFGITGTSTRDAWN